jgi:phage baseplate assembly protein W
VADTATPGFLGRGWRFPVKPDASGRLNYISGDEEIRQSVWLIVTTARRERVMREEFGCGLYDLVFDANTAALHGLVQESIRSALVRWEPRIDVLGVRAEAAGAQRNLLLIRIDYRIRANNTVFNLVYPYYLLEGTP